ncbi:MAG TPA: substrate-binding domain-containing protein [Rudaea sp.]
MNKSVIASLLSVALSFGLIAAASAQNAPKTAAKPAAAAKAPVKPKAAAVPPAAPIIVRGDHCTARVTKDLVKYYETTKQGKVTVQPFSTISGLDAVDSGAADIAASARPAMPGRSEEAKTNFIPVAWDAVVPITSPKNPVSNLTLQQLHDIYLGKIGDWSEVGGQPGPINLVAVAGPLDGVEYNLRLLLFHDGDKRVAAPRLYVNTEKLEEAIAIDPRGLGITTLSGAHGNPAIKILTVEGVSANSATISDGSYPLFNALYFGVRDDGRNRDAVTRFIEFTATDSGKAILRKRELVPYADAPGLVDKQEARVAWVNERVHATMLVAASTDEQPNSAPRATAQALERVAPTSQRTLEAKDRAARADAERAEKKAPETAGH